MTFAEDYNTVPERIVEFRAKYPEGTLQSTILYSPGDVPGWVVEARAYRTEDDQRPGIGLAFEPVPGKTNFTRDSELQNCETSAWGRAIVAVGAADAKKGIASAEDIRNRDSGATEAAMVHTSPSSVSVPVGTDFLPAPAGAPSSAAEAHIGEESSTTTSTAADASGGEGTDGGEPHGVTAPSSSETSQEIHVHGPWLAAPRAGFLICQGTRNGKPCGFAEKSSRVPGSSYEEGGTGYGEADHDG